MIPSARLLVLCALATALVASLGSVLAIGAWAIVAVDGLLVALALLDALVVMRLPVPRLTRQVPRRLAVARRCQVTIRADHGGAEPPCAGADAAAAAGARRLPADLRRDPRHAPRLAAAGRGPRGRLPRRAPSRGRASFGQTSSTACRDRPHGSSSDRGPRQRHAADITT